MALTKKVNGVDVQMTAQEEAMHIADQQAATAKADLENTAEETFRTQLKNLLSPIGGKRYDQITAAEVRILVALLVHENFRGIDRATGNYKPINQWVR